MELEVHGVPGMHNCFAALPFGMIEALQGGSNGPLFSVTLELRLAHRRDLCYLFWAGAASTSSSIEVSDRLAQCLGLITGNQAYVRALPNVTDASTVVLEPATEDDWEILEANAGFVEDHILSQVGVLCSGQQFPVWVLGQNILMLSVISTLPKGVVRLVPGTELIIAPKPRQNHSQRLSETKANLSTSSHESFSGKAWLRIQEFDLSLAHPCALGDLSFLVLPTIAIFVSPETAQGITFMDGQLVVVTCEDIQGTKRKLEQERGQNLIAKPGVPGNDDKNSKLIVVRLVYCNLVSEGHVMIASSLRLLIGAEIHTCIEVSPFSQTTSTLLPFFILSPMGFKTLEGFSDNYAGNTYGQEVTMEGAPRFAVATEKIYKGNNWEWEKHKELLKIASDINNMTSEVDQASFVGGKPPSVGSHEAKCLFEIWAGAQFASISKCAHGQSSSIPLQKEAVMQFLLSVDVKRHLELVSMYSKETGIRESSLRTRNGWKTKPSKFLYFMLSLHNLNEQQQLIEINHEAHDTEALTAYMGVFLFDQNILEIENGLGLRKQVQDTAGPYKIKLGKPNQSVCSVENDLKERQSPRLSSLAWLKEPASEALRRLQILLSPEIQDKYDKLGLTFPGYVLIHGPPACGKTKLALAIATELEEDPSILAHKILVKCAELAQEQAQSVKSTLLNTVSEALRHAPSIIVLDDLNMAIPAVVNTGDSEPSTTAVVLAEFLSDLIDNYQIHGRKIYGAAIAFLAVVEAVSNIPASLCSSGRFDFHIALPVPAVTERAAILYQELEQRSLTCQQDIINEIASKCDGYDTSDLEVVVDRAVHVAAARFLSLSTHKTCISDNGHTYIQKLENHVKERKGNDHMLSVIPKQNFELLHEDFTQALKEFLPASMRDIKRAGDQVGRLGWEDVGGLKETCQILKEMLELPVKYRKIFSNAPLRLRSGVLLYGPPGCGKTHLVGAAAAACSLRFISIKGPELLNKYIGASEQGVRDIFAKASAAAPCLLFFDEFDAIAPKRGHDNTGVTDRVVNQLLTELDGVEALNDVFVFAATSRPDLLDAALLRPGRLDRLLFCDFPTSTERLEILQVLSRKLSVGEDVNLNVVASLTENFSGADLQAILSDAQLEAVNNFLIQSNHEGVVSGKSEEPLITMAVLRSVLEKARPSISQGEQQRLYGIYKAFMNSRSSIAGKARDAKGKRVTLA